MSRKTCRLLLGILITLMCSTPIVSISLAMVFAPKFILFIFLDSLWIVLGVLLVEYATNRYGGNW